ncbi:uncharacterized protein BO72DRAFT_248721 [Aspergillus fijiensis CBS 313.89]|uniref:Uncharacterized protein n=1 Tax=Aspergillus fijiensis CBS 313.89 TaxID=1448319 RepID=A0A8G1RIS5_9EURO|nr:uncharacterized protein BO72DRAFT_248721 [Aspergillus fijiensis CBS 313.89]RAK73167.1 hypothetical protein BO72DRAFT_248721 [Aspergillus fijiensis CBS 313.89]
MFLAPRGSTEMLIYSRSFVGLIDLLMARFVCSIFLLSNDRTCLDMMVFRVEVPFGKAESVRIYYRVRDYT